MAAVTICSDFGAQENKVCYCFQRPKAGAPRALWIAMFITLGLLVCSPVTGGFKQKIDPRAFVLDVETGGKMMGPDEGKMGPGASGPIVGRRGCWWTGVPGEIHLLWDSGAWGRTARLSCPSPSGL